jgi:hypothetical protein
VFLSRVRTGSGNRIENQKITKLFEGSEVIYTVLEQNLSLKKMGIGFRNLFPVPQTS